MHHFATLILFVSLSSLSPAYSVTTAEGVDNLDLAPRECKMGYMGVSVMLIHRVFPLTLPENIIGDLEENQGIVSLVTHVVKGSPGDLAGIKSSDIILDVVYSNSWQPHDPWEKGLFIGCIQEEEIVTMAVFSPETKSVRTVRTQPILAKDNVREPGALKASFASMTRSTLKAYGFPDLTGAMLIYVQENSEAMRAGLKEGDFIIGIDGQRILSLADLQNSLDNAYEGQVMAVEFYRDGGYFFTKLLLEKIPRNHPSNP